MPHFDIAIIGGGSGLTAATHALKDDKSVALIDAKPDQLGGTCVNRGCLPTKQLIQTAEAMRGIKAASKFGVSVPADEARVDFPSIVNAMREKRAERAKGARDWVESEMTPFFGRATFVGDRTIEMDSGERLTAETVFLCTGAGPRIPPIEGVEDTAYLTNRSVLMLEEQPQSLIIVGGGYIGCEFAHFFQAIGTEVTLVTTTDRCLNDEDEEIADLFTQEIGKRVRLVKNGRGVAIREASGGTEVDVDTPDGQQTFTAERVLLATGRTPNTQATGLDATGVELDEKGWITVDDRLRTTNENIYAYGDCIGQAMFKHTSSYEGELAYRNSQGADETVDYHANPHAVFTEPEIASVGLTERHCKSQGLDYLAESIPYAGIAKGEIVGSPAGLAKAIVEKDSGKILGVHLAGPHSALLVQEAVIAMSNGLTARSIRDAIHIHPSMTELLQTLFRKFE